MSLLKKETAAAFELVYRFPLYDQADDNGSINACISGTDPFSEEFLKAAVWSTQREGFRLNLDICGSREECERLERQYPELFHTERLYDSGEIFCKVTLISGEIPPDKEYGFVFSASPSGCGPSVIRSAKRAVVLKNETAAALYEGNAACASEIKLDGEKFFRESGIEEMGLALFGSFNAERKQLFYENEYYYRSSAASVLFWSLRKKQGLDTGVTEQNMMLEHRRWSAFTRTEGYRYGSVRSDAEKLHPCLVAWDMLDREIQEYDAEPIRVVNRHYDTKDPGN